MAHPFQKYRLHFRLKHEAPNLRKEQSHMIMEINFQEVQGISYYIDFV